MNNWRPKLLKIRLKCLIGQNRFTAQMDMGDLYNVAILKLNQDVQGESYIMFLIIYTWFYKGCSLQSIGVP